MLYYFKNLKEKGKFLDSYKPPKLSVGKKSNGDGMAIPDFRLYCRAKVTKQHGAAQKQTQSNGQNRRSKHKHPNYNPKTSTAEKTEYSPNNAKKT